MGLCTQKNCDAVARRRWIWPGGGAQETCVPHAVQATNIANVMGFELRVDDITTGQEEGADRFSLIEVEPAEATRGRR